jgi:hypothetical protein
MISGYKLGTTAAPTSPQRRELESAGFSASNGEEKGSPLARSRDPPEVLEWALSQHTDTSHNEHTDNEDRAA